MTANFAQPESGTFFLVSDYNFSCFTVNLYALFSSLADGENFDPLFSLLNHHHHYAQKQNKAGLEVFISLSCRD